MSEEDKELLRLFDEAVARMAKRRFTFTDEEALRPLWDEGYDISFQSDPFSRFALAAEADGNHRRQWRLHTQTLANNRLLDALTSDTWDGRDLESELSRLDTEDHVQYIFCPTDTRFTTLPDGTLESAGRERTLTLSSAEQAELDALGPALLEQWHDEDAQPLTVRQITEKLDSLGWSKAGERDGWLVTRAWLSGWSSVFRAGQDYWIPTDAVPEEPTRSRLQVLPVSSPVESEEMATGDMGPEAIIDDRGMLPGPVSTSLPGKNQVIQGVPIITRPVHWTQPLRTMHLLEGSIPVPLPARSAYPPRAKGEGDKQVLRGLWFDSDEQMWLWLDRTHDRLYGPDLAHQLEWLEAGDLLRIDWLPDSIVLRRAGHDDEILREEMRLVDPVELRALRGGLGESYRQSLQTILSAAPDGLTFAQVVVALRERQGHDVHRGTVRTLLYASGFRYQNGRWFAISQDKDGARRLRSALIESLETKEQPGQMSKLTTSANRLSERVHTIRVQLAELVKQIQQESKL